MNDAPDQPNPIQEVRAVVKEFGPAVVEAVDHVTEVVADSLEPAARRLMDVGSEAYRRLQAAIEAHPAGKGRE